MKDELVRKITQTLNDGINTEKDLVYLLVEIRKLMDREKYQDGVIKSFSNWVVHHELSLPGSGTTKLLEEFDECLRLQIEENRGTGFPSHYSFQTFKENLRKLFTQFKLPTDILDKQDAWNTFTRLYSTVVSDCPITFEASSKSLKYVAKIELISPDSPVSISGRNPIPFLEWTVTQKNGTVGHHAIMVV